MAEGQSSSAQSPFGLRVFQTMLSTEQAMLQALRQISQQNRARDDMINRFSVGSNTNNNEHAAPAAPAAPAPATNAAYRPVSAESLGQQFAASQSGPQQPSEGGESGNGEPANIGEGSSAAAPAAAGGGAGGSGSNGGGPSTPAGGSGPQDGSDGSGDSTGSSNSGSTAPGSGAAGNGVPFLGGAQHLLGRVPVLGGLINGAINNSPIVKGYTAITGEVQSQQDKNDYYRNIEGGGNLDAEKERAGEEWFAAKQQASMTMSSGDARTLWKGLTRLGYDGQSDAGGYSRSDMTAFAVNAKKERAEDPNEALSQAASFSRNATANLKEFNNALNSVSQVASKAGINTNMARAQMQSMFDQFTQQGMGSGATKMAATVTNMNNSIGGRAYSQGTDSSGMTSDAYESMVAASSGMSQSQLAAGLRNKSQSAYKAYDQFWQKNVTALTEGHKSWIKQYKQAHPKATNDQIANEFLNHFETGGAALGNDWIPEENTWVANMESLTGQHWNGDSHKAALFAVQIATGQNPLEKAAKHATKGGKTSSNMATTAVKTLTGGGGGGSGSSLGESLSGKGSYVSQIGGKGSYISQIGGKGSYFSEMGGKGSYANEIVHSDAAKSIGHAASSAWNWLTGDGGGHKDTGAPKPQPKPHGHYAKNSTSDHGQSAGTPTHQVVIDVTPTARKLVKAMVVTGGDPYAAAHAASSAAPAEPYQTSTR